MRIGLQILIILTPWISFAQDSKKFEDNSDPYSLLRKMDSSEVANLEKVIEIANEREHSSILKLSGGGIGDLTRPGIQIKAYKICTQADSCSPYKWVGLFGKDLLPNLKNDSNAIRQWRRFRTAAILKSGFYAAVPISLFSGTLDAMKGKESIVIGMTLFSLAGAVAAHIIENKQFYKIERMYNKESIQFGIDSGNGFDQIGVTCLVRI